VPAMLALLTDAQAGGLRLYATRCLAHSGTRDPAVSRFTSSAVTSTRRLPSSPGRTTPSGRITKDGKNGLGSRKTATTARLIGNRVITCSRPVTFAPPGRPAWWGR
jgi:hypothetical protein